MKLTQIHFNTEKKINSNQVNSSFEEIDKKIEEELTAIPDKIFEVKYVIDGTEHRFNLKSLLDIDVHELSELTLSNLRVQIEKIASIRFTLERAYEQFMEDFAVWEVNYEIWWSNTIITARKKYWEDQLKLFTDAGLAKSGMKTPTQDDLKFTALLVEGIRAEYELKKEKQARLEQKRNFFVKTDEILKNRGFELKTIIESRVGKG